MSTNAETKKSLEDVELTVRGSVWVPVEGTFTLQDVQVFAEATGKDEEEWSQKVSWFLEHVAAEGCIRWKKRRGDVEANHNLQVGCFELGYEGEPLTLDLEEMTKEELEDLDPEAALALDEADCQFAEREDAA